MISSTATALWMMSFKHHCKYTCKTIKAYFYALHTNNKHKCVSENYPSIAFWFLIFFFIKCVHALLIKLWANKWTNGVLGKDGVYWRYAYIIVKGKFISLEIVVSIFPIALLHFIDGRVSFTFH